jgi:hypothetical protein
MWPRRNNLLKFLAATGNVSAHHLLTNDRRVTIFRAIDKEKSPTKWPGSSRGES